MVSSVIMGSLPAELLARGRHQVTTHGGLIIEGCVTGIERFSNEHFRIYAGNGHDDPRTFDARRILLATGLRDVTPDCPGFRDFYGVSVHHCPDCDGYECIDKRIAVLGSGTKTVGFALSLLTWTNTITVINEDKDGFNKDDRAKLSAFRINVRDQSIKALDGDSKSKQLRRILFSGGDALECDALFFNLGTEPASNLHEMLGCKLDEDCGLVWVDQTRQTSVEGVYAGRRHHTKLPVSHCCRSRRRDGRHPYPRFVNPFGAEAKNNQILHSERTSGIELASSWHDCNLTRELIHLRALNKGDKCQTIHYSQMRTGKFEFGA
jgi:thioredoxin reductase